MDKLRVPSHILMTADAVGGVWTYALELTRSLAAYRVSVTLAVLGPPPSEAQREEAREIPNMELVEIPLRLEWMEDPWEDLEAAGKELMRLAESRQVDLVHLNGYVHAALPWRVPCLVVAHSCVLSWWRAVKGECAPDSWMRYRHEVLRGLKSASMVVAPTAAMLHSLEENYLPLPQGRVIHNGRNPSAFHPGKKENLVLTAGRLWDEAKNVAAVERVARRLPWPVAVAGEEVSPQGERVTLQNVRHLGRLASGELASWYARASIYALPARYEPFGLTPLEAALSGCALVLGRIDTLRELWSGCALFVDPENQDELAVALVELMNNEAARFRLVKRGAERARDLSPGQTAAGYIDAYSTLLEPSKRHPRSQKRRTAAGSACA